MKKGNKLGIFVFAITLLSLNLVHAEESMDYAQLMAKSSEALKQAKSYTIEMEAKNFFRIDSQEDQGNPAKLNIAFISPDKFKVEQLITEGSENLWDGWIVIGEDYYVLNPMMGWEKGEDENRKALSKNNSPENVIKQMQEVEARYKRNSISSVAKDGKDYFVIKYSFGKELVDVESLPPQLKDAKVNGTHEIWINKQSYLPSKQSSEVSYYSDEHNKGTVSTTINYSSYNEDAIKITEPVLGSRDF